MKEGKSIWAWFAIVCCVMAWIASCAVLAGKVHTGAEQPAVACTAETERVKRLVPVGRTVGIKLFSKGVMVVALSELNTSEGAVWPAKDCGLEVGDVITEIDHTSVNSIEEVEHQVRDAGGDAMEIQALRNGKRMEMTAVPCLCDGTYKLGAWLRDSMAGIGTVTYFDPQDKTFAALGHGINDVDTGLLIPVRSGGIMASTVTAVVRGEKSEPGQLHGTFDLTGDIGTLFANGTGGVFGRTTSGLFDGQAIPVAKKSEAHTGAAVIRCNVEGDKVEEFTVEILRIYPELGDTTRNLLLQVDDERLLRITGGIVQGMSGSPILQNGKLVGAVTHVCVRP